MSRVSLLTDLNEETDRWRIITRVFRKWSVYQKSSPTEIFCITMILVDAEGNRIQASVLNRTLINQFMETPVEGRVYFFANFEVSANLNQYRGTNSPFKITFTQQTYMREEERPLPAHGYSFTPITEILKCSENKYIDHLIDVIAFVQSIGSLEEYRKENETKHKMRMVLVDNEENEVECVLFDECSTVAYSSYLQNRDTPIVVVLNLARVGFAEDGRPQICSSFTATRVLFNPSLPDVDDFIEIAKEKASPVMTCMTQPMPTQSGQPLVEYMLRNNRRIDIAELKNQRTDEPFIISCVVMKLETRHGWTYDGCSKCSSKPKLEDANVYCLTCKKIPEALEPKMKVHYVVEDETGKASVIFWDKLAVQLFNNNAAEMKVTLEKDNRAYDFPCQLDELVGKRMILKLKLNDYNKRYPSSSISVLQYTVCEDLMNQFLDVLNENDVANDNNTTEVNVNDGVEDGVEYNENEGHGEAENVVPSELPRKANNMEKNYGSSEQNIEGSQANPDGDMTLSQLSEVLTAPSNKGKRKSYSKRVVGPGPLEPRKSTNSASSSSRADRILKVVKEEK